MYKNVLRPLLFRALPDQVHEFTIRWASRTARSAIQRKMVRMMYDHQSPLLSQEILGMKFRNPVGLAAGFDKNGTMAPLFEALGFGFVEVGSITAKAGTGNPKPRNFRLPLDESLINRMGLNNDGAATITKRLRNLDLSIPLGVNIAKTHNPTITGEEALEDYLESFLLAIEVADYITLNISCPNTLEGKTFEDPEALSALMAKLHINSDLSLPPVFVKFSSDLEKGRIEELMDVCRANAISGYIAANTSSKREGLKTPAAELERIGQGGLSGKAIREPSTRLIRIISEFTRGEKPIIGVGGIYSPEDALEKLHAGADLLQVYTGLIYEGPALVRRINRGIEQYLQAEGIDQLSELHKLNRKSAPTLS